MAQLYQWSVPCTICEKPVEFHCNTCGDVLCPTCKKNHLKSNATKHHQIVPYSERVRPNQGKECNTHPGHQCGYWCTTCDEQVCSDCMAFGKHRGHDFQKYEAKLKENKKRIQNLFRSYLTLQSQWGDSLRDLMQRKGDFEKEVQKEEKEIKQQADRICNEVRRVEKTKTKKLREAAELSLVAFSRQEQRLSSGIATIKSHVKETDDALRSDDISGLPDPSVIEQRIREANLPQLEFPSSLTFQGESLSKVAAIFGDIVSDPSADSIIHTELDPQSGIPALACVGSDAWIRSAEGTLQLMDRSGKVKKTVNLNFWTHDLSVTKDKLLLVPDHINKCIWSVSSNESLRLLFETEWGPYALCTLTNGDTLVSFRYDRRVAQYSTKGKIKQEAQMGLYRSPEHLNYFKKHRKCEFIGKLSLKP